MVKRHAGASREARERRDADLLREFPRHLFQTVGLRAGTSGSGDRSLRVAPRIVSAPSAKRIESITCSRGRLSNHLYLRSEAKRHSSTRDWPPPGNLSDDGNVPS